MSAVERMARAPRPERRPEASAAAPLHIVVRNTLAVIVLVAVALLLWRIAYALLLGFAGVLVAAFFRGVAGKLRDWTRLPMGWSLAVVWTVLLGLLVAAVWLAGPAVGEQVAELGRTLPSAVEQVRGYLEQQVWGREILQWASRGQGQGQQAQGWISRGLSSITGTLSTLADGAIALVVVFAAGIFFSIAPHTYTAGLVRLVPPARQERAREVLEAGAQGLWRWLLGQFVIMVSVGVLTTAGLLLLGVPLAPLLGLIAGLFEFVPFLGPLAAAVPILLVALTAGPTTTLYTALFLLVLQQVESNLLEPIVQRRAVHLPPVLILLAAVSFGLLFGLLGIIVATPLTLIGMILVEKLYVEDMLGQHGTGEALPRDSPVREAAQPAPSRTAEGSGSE